MPHPTGAESSEESVEDSNRYDDAEEDADMVYRAQLQAQAQAQAASIADQYGDNDDYDDEEDDDDDDEAEELDSVEAIPSMVQYHGIRGKPEAMTAALAASTIDELREEREATRHIPEEVDAMMEATAVVAEPVLDTPGSGKIELVDAHAIPDPEYVVSLKPPSSKKKKKSIKKSTSTPKKSPKATVPIASSPTLELELPSLDDPTEPITDAEYENLVHLMAHFCKVPLLAEFSRPVTLLHPELQAAYSKIIKHPIDLGKVCRKIRRRVYNNTREVQLDMWRIFSNCVKYHSHPSNKEAVPSFVSIALHLREYWNNLFQVRSNMSRSFVLYYWLLPSALLFSRAI
jgi:Bromodomain